MADRLENTTHPDVLVAKEPLIDEGNTPEEPEARAEYLTAQARSEAGAGLGLVILGSTRREDGRPLVYLSLSDGSQVVTRSYQFGGESKLTRRWISIRALDLVRRYLIGALDEEIG